MKHIEEVRKALDKAEYDLLDADLSSKTADECRAAMNILSVLEADVKELVEAARNVLCEIRDRSDGKQALIAALSKFTEAK